MNKCLAVCTLLLPLCSCQSSNPPATPGAGKKVLFNGKDTSQWQHRDGRPCGWVIVDDAMEVRGGDVVTKEKFTDFVLHVEFCPPDMPPEKRGEERGNSGVYLQDRYEVQVLDSFGVSPETKGDCGAIHAQKAPDMNACKPPGQWQTYDITFTAARFDASGKKTRNARVTVVQNGQTIHGDVEIEKPTGAGAPETADPGPIRLQDHENPVRYRNIWITPKSAN